MVRVPDQLRGEFESLAAESETTPLAVDLAHDRAPVHRIRVRAVLFDMDGVLISSTGSDERSWRRWARLHGVEDTFSIASTHGRRAIDTVVDLRPDLDAATEVQRLEDFDAEDSAGIISLAGVEALLPQLDPARWGIVTSASERLMRNRLRIARLEVPQMIVTADMVARGKPDPEPYLLGAERLGFAPGECLVIEDAPSGISAGKDAGCKVLAVTTSHAASYLAHADWIIDSLASLRVESSHDGWFAFAL